MTTLKKKKKNKSFNASTTMELRSPIRSTPKMIAEIKQPFLECYYSDLKFSNKPQ